MRFRFVHAADLHLDTPFVGLELLDATLAQRLRDASLDALDRIVTKAIEVDAAFVVFAGDLYDGVERGIRAQLHFRAALVRLADQGIQSFVAHGNHDPEGGRWTAVRAWPERVTVFASGAPQSVAVVRDGVALATVHGVSYGAKAERENLALRFARPAGGGPHVAVLHCSVDRAPGHENYSPCNLDDLRSRGMTYWALGHVHQHRVLAREPWVVYPGNTQGRGIGVGERGAKGALGVEPFATDKARFFELQVDIGDASDIATLSDKLREQAEALADENEGTDVILRARLTGRGALHGEIKRLRVREELLAGVRDLARRAWWLSLEDGARPALDLERIRAGQDLRSEVLATWDVWRASEGWAALPAALRAEPDRVGRLTPELLAELLPEAAYDVVERLTGEEW